MIETQVQDAPEVKEEQVLQVNAFDESGWSETPIEKKEPVVEVKQETIAPEVKAEIVPDIKVDEKPEPSVASKPTEEPFILDPKVQEKFYNDTYEVLAQKKELEKVTSLDLTKVNDAKKLLELSLKFKNSGLDSEEIKDEIAEKYSYPKEPKMKADEDQEDFDERLSDWKERVEKINKRIVRDAKQAKPELESFNSKLVLPEIPKYEQKATQQEPSPEEVADFNKRRSAYLSSIESGVKGLNDFTVASSNKDVPISVSYKVDESEKTLMHTRLSDFNPTEYLKSRWTDAEGNYKGSQQAKDIYILENHDKIVQKQVNEAINQTLAYIEKSQKQITVKGEAPRGTFQPETDKQKEYETLWSA
jgi:hypothetical protein